MTKTTGAIGLSVAAVTVTGGVFLYSSGGGGTARDAAAYEISLNATPRTVDEGDLVEFAAIARSVARAGEGPAGDAAVGTRYSWNFDEGAPPTTGLDLRSMSHRFVDGDGSATARLVRVEVGASNATIRIVVNNVAPTIRSLTRSRPARRGEPVEFQAAATDPGQADELTYAWDFADGSTATGQQVTHTFASDGTYDVAVTVDDGDGGTDRAILSVPVGDAGSFRVSGDFTVPETKVGRVALTGTPPRGGAGGRSPCEFRLAMHGDPADGEPIMTLSARLDSGLGERRYRIAGTNDWDGMRDDEGRSPQTFFADFSAPARFANRDFNGLTVGGPFWSRHGLVTVEYFDGTYLELSYWATFVENIPADYHPRTVFVEGTFSGRVETSADLARILAGLATGAGNVYTCGRDDTTTFGIDRRQPVSNAENVDYQNPGIEVAFTKAIDPASIGSNLHIDLRMLLRGRSVHLLVPGAWEMVSGDPHAVRFVPQSPLRSGVIYCVRVRAGQAGVRSTDGSILEASAPGYDRDTGPACGTAQPFLESDEWAFSTRVELEHARADLYQASKAGGDTPLVPDKPTVSRVYAHWTGRDDVHNDAEVKRFRARVDVRADGRSVYPASRVWITRPDLLTAEDARFARNSTNFFNWRPDGSGGTVRIQPTIEFIDETGAAIGRFDGMIEQVGLWDRRERLTFDYYFLQVNGCEAGRNSGCDWSADIDAEWIDRANALMAEDIPFTTQNFPVVETVGRPMGTLSFDEPAIGPCRQRSGRCYDAGTSNEQSRVAYAGARLFEAGLASDADVIVGFVPDGYLGDAAGMVVNFQDRSRRIVLVELTADHDEVHSVMPHEFGHFFDLSHCPDLERSPDCAYRVQGFRVSPSGRSGFNKHDQEGNQEATVTLLPIMRSRGGQPRYHFISTAHYLKLFRTIPNGPRRLSAASPVDLRRNPLPLLATVISPVRLLAQEPADAGTVLLTGSVAGQAIVLRRVIHRPDMTPVPTATRASGSLALDLLDAAGRVLRTIPIDPAEPDTSHGMPADEPSTFLVEVPAPAGLHAVRLTGPGGAVAERTRSRAVPVIRAELSDSSAASRTLRWTADDADGDDVRVSVYLRADDSGPWRTVAVDTARTELTLRDRDLPHGRTITARLVATDGFNASTADVVVGAGGSLRILAVMPADGATDVAANAEVVVWLSGLPAGSAPDRGAAGDVRLTLRGPSGVEVSADLSFQRGTGLMTLTPTEPLQPGARYSATIAGVTSDQTSVTWSFTTGARPSRAP